MVQIKCPDGQVGWTHGSHIDSSVPLYKYKSENKQKNQSDSQQLHQNHQVKKYQIQKTQ